VQRPGGSLNSLSLLSRTVIATALVATAFGWHQSVRAAGQALSPHDQEFIIKAEEADVRERAIARVVADRSEDPAIRRFAALENKAHSNGLHQLGSLMQKYGIRPPVSIVQAHVAGIAQLEGFWADALDNEFLELAAQNHSSEIELLSDEAATGDEPEVRRYARNALPQFQADLLEGHNLRRMQ
jgi:putative membrane protein